MVRRAVVSLRGCGHGCAMAGGEELSITMGQRWGNENERGREEVDTELT